MKTAAYLINRSCCRANLENKIPHKLFYDEVPDIGNLRIFGCVAYQHVDEAVRKQKQVMSKLDPRAVPKLHMGYIDTEYLLMDLKTKSIFRSYNVHHIETENKTNLLKIVEDDETASN